MLFLMYVQTFFLVGTEFVQSLGVNPNFATRFSRLRRGLITYQQLKLGSKIVDIVDEVVKFLHKATPIYNFISLHLFKEIDEGEKFFYYLLEKSWFLTKETNTKRLQY